MNVDFLMIKNVFNSREFTKAKPDFSKNVDINISVSITCIFGHCLKSIDQT